MVIELSLEHILVLTTHVASSVSCGMPWRASGLTHEQVPRMLISLLVLRDGRANESTAKIQWLLIMHVLLLECPIFNFVNDTLFATVQFHGSSARWCSTHAARCRPCATPPNISCDVARINCISRPPLVHLPCHSPLPPSHPQVLEFATLTEGVSMQALRWVRPSFQWPTSVRASLRASPRGSAAMPSPSPHHQQLQLQWRPRAPRTTRAASSITATLGVVLTSRQ
jgi:hypothetical protein